jgi:SAM-dependent methyltransferase
MTAALDYAGEELETFAAAENWKRYVRAQLGPYLIGRVAEVGAGIGETTRALRSAGTASSWLAIEPDHTMAAQVEAKAATGELGPQIEVFAGILADLPPQEQFDTIIYIDVLEHIADDRAELETARARLKPGGLIVVLAPAWPFLFSPFDAAIGHFRRYTRTMLRTVAPTEVREVRANYLDSVGMLASAANRFLLRQKAAGGGQVLVWDRLMVPISRVLDRLLLRSLGRSVVIVWQAK